MSNIDKRALREAAEKAQEHGVFNMDIHSQTVLALLDELEAKDKRVAELEAREVKLNDINEYLAEVHDKTLNRAFRLLAEGVRAGDVASIRAAGINIDAAGKGE